MLGAYLFITAGLAAFSLLFVIIAGVLVATGSRGSDIYDHDVKTLKQCLIVLGLSWLWPVAVLGTILLAGRGIYQAFKKEK